MYPGDQRKLIYNLYPLLSGYVALPPLRLLLRSHFRLTGELRLVLTM